MVLTVHHLQVSQSERIPWLCEELGIPYDLKIYQRAPVLAPPELKALTPMKASPVITDGSLTLSESGAIVEYIIHKYGSGRLALPPSHKDYADYLYWFHFSNGNLQPALGLLFRCAVVGIPQSDLMYQMSADGVRKVLANVENRVGSATWLAGDEFTAADIMTVWCLTGMRMFVPVDLSGYPNILKYLERVSEREAFKTAMKKGDPERDPCLKGPPPEVFEGFGRTYAAHL